MRGTYSAPGNGPILGSPPFCAILELYLNKIVYNFWGTNVCETKKNFVLDYFHEKKKNTKNNSIITAVWIFWWIFCGVSDHPRWSDYTEIRWALWRSPRGTSHTKFVRWKRIKPFNLLLYKTTFVYNNLLLYSLYQKFN